MNYEQKYNKALERAMKLKENPQSVFNEYSPKEGDTICDYIFPELKESEDEKIRKELIEHVKDQQSSFISAPDCRDKYEEEENDKYNSWLAWLEEQGEQNPTDNVEPKFKVGDVIFAKSKFNGDSFIRIFLKLDENKSWAYCNICSNGYFDASKGFLLLSRYDFYPASKEQRGLLFQKMKEAGYSWDAEKKELKKIEHRKENKVMTQKDKELLLKDLCGRLLYGVICQIYDPQQDYEEDIFDARLIHIDAWTSHCYFWGCSETDPYKIEQVKPYLRPMSSMTEEEKREFQSFFPGCFGDQWLDIEEGTIEIFECSSTMTLYLYDFERMIDWLNAHHFDYRGLIEKGLAIEVTKENNPYKE